MISAPKLRGLSVVRTLSEYTVFHRGLQFGEAYDPRPIAAALPGNGLDVLRARLSPVLASLDRDRAAHVDQADRFLLKRAIPGAALVGLVVGCGVSGDIGLGLFLAGLGGFAALIVLFGLSMYEPRKETRSEIVDALTRHLMNFRVDPSPVIGTEEIEELKLFSRDRKVAVDLCLTGQRNGCIVVASRIGLMFGYENRRRQKQGDGLNFVMVEVGLPETADTGTITTIMAKDASMVLTVSQKLMHRESSVPTGDPDFDDRYSVTGDVTRMTPAFRAAGSRGAVRADRPDRSARRHRFTPFGRDPARQAGRGDAADDVRRRV